MIGASRALICDGTFDGFLSAQFDAHIMKPPPVVICCSEPIARDMTLEYTFVATDQAKARRLLRGIHDKLSSETGWRVECLWRCEYPGAGRMCFDYLQLGWRLGRALDMAVQEPLVMDVELISRRVGKEVHLMRGMLRFSLKEGGVYYAEFVPDNHIVDVLAEHFVARMSDVPWIIHDVRRNVCALYDTRGVVLRDFHDLTLPPDTEEEGVVAALWRTYHRTVAIASRVNPKLQAQMMPRRYWKHMTEMRPPARDGGGQR